MIKTLLEERQGYTKTEVLLSASQIVSVRVKIVTCLEHENKHINVICIVASVESAVQQVPGCAKSGSNKAVKQRFVELSRKKENYSV